MSILIVLSVCPAIYSFTAGGTEHATNQDFASESHSFLF